MQKHNGNKWVTRTFFAVILAAGVVGLVQTSDVLAPTPASAQMVIVD